MDDSDSKRDGQIWCHASMFVILFANYYHQMAPTQLSSKKVQLQATTCQLYNLFFWIQLRPLELQNPLCQTFPVLSYSLYPCNSIIQNQSISKILNCNFCLHSPRSFLAWCLCATTYDHDMLWLYPYTFWKLSLCGFDQLTYGIVFWRNGASPCASAPSQWKCTSLKQIDQ